MTTPVLAAEEQNAILGSVTTLLVQRLRGDWEQLFIDFRVVGDHVETDVSGVTMFGGPFRWELPVAAMPFFTQLREGMARPGRGTWVSLRFHLVHPDTYSVEFNHDQEPDWTSPPTAEDRADELARYPRDSPPDWLAARAPELIAAPLLDDPHGGLIADRPRVHPQELADVLEYLESAPVVLTTGSYGPDAFQPDLPPSVPLSFHTDGTWVWSGGVAYYLRNHHVAPAPQLVQHIRDNDYAVPPVNPTTQSAAAAVATGQARSAPLPPHTPRVISDADRHALEHLKNRLDHYGVGEGEYGIVEPKPDALVIEPAPGPSGWQVQFWDADRGPHGRPKVHEHAVDAAKALLAQLLWRDDLDEVRAGGRARAVRPVPDIQPLPDEPPLSLFRDREAVVLPVGTEVDRFGDDTGNLVYAAGTAYGNRSLPPEWLNRAYHGYLVRQPVPALKGVAVPWFGQVGGGTGYFLARPVRDLLADGSLVEIG
ncbi:TNT domain-containing protein [Saccharothrix obliqua]|uniref:TNT domain-containing protein n=1 Tax=Saccharothrix obliqua TaxID=2861747 RepID=UPI001C5DE1AC|nr:TNT domain-containing protein [Saccharothrix obliqua]MBW4716081.1 glycohydrolase toxin TNT-related protein [Saccharothrix obliqua]